MDNPVGRAQCSDSAATIFVLYYERYGTTVNLYRRMNNGGLEFLAQTYQTPDEYFEKPTSKESLKRALDKVNPLYLPKWQSVIPIHDVRDPLLEVTLPYTPSERHAAEEH